MYPRLQLLYKLLSEDGAIFISIDRNEFAALKFLCDHIFNNFVGCISWQRTYSPRNDSKGIVSETEYIMAYSKRPDWQPNRLERTEEMDSKYKNPDNDWCAWMSSDASAPGAATHKGMVYAIQSPFNGEFIYPTKNRCWTFEQPEMLRIMNQWCPYELKSLNDVKARADVCGVAESEVDKDIYAIVLSDSLEKSRESAHRILERGQWPKLFFTKNGDGGIRRKSYLEQVEGRIVTNLWLYDEVGHTDEAKKELKDIFGGKIPFDTPKPLRLIERILHIATKPNSIVLDSFAGSGTLGHAVIHQNQKDGGQRKFIMIEMMDYAETTTAERVKRVISGYPTKQKHEEELYSKKLTIANLKNATTFLAEANTVIEQNKDKYAEISKPKIQDNCIKVIASTVTDGKVAGIDAAFDFYEIGEPIFTDDGYLNESVGAERMREYIFYADTHQSLPTNSDSYLMGNYQDAAYYFYYKQDAMTELNIDTLSELIVAKADHYVIYADSCTLSAEFMAKYNITFKKIPRDIRRF
jgi:adenine-specific DNA-methyltransferase